MGISIHKIQASKNPFLKVCKNKLKLLKKLTLKLYYLVEMN